MNKFFEKLSLWVLIILIISNANAFGQKNDDPDKKKPVETQKITVEAESIDEADNSMKNFIKENFILLPDNITNNLITKRTIEAVLSSDSGNTKNALFYKVSYDIPENYLLDTIKILWELNVPEFRSHLYQLYGNDTIYLDTWNNVVGMSKPDTKTNTGYFEAYRIRNWPSWKDPEKGKEDLPPTPPGPKNPLGLFVVHFDENSLRYFHGTNKEYLLDDKTRNLSHGCVRNLNGNIAKMKEFIIRRVVKSKDLSYWFDSQKTMSYDFEDSERFPVNIIYKTYCFGKDENGAYVELYKDIYNYRNRNNINLKYNNPELVFLTTKENLIKEYRTRIGNEMSDEELNKLIDYITSHCKEYERYYLDELK
jgi:hypothetical protein